MAHSLGAKKRRAWLAIGTVALLVAIAASAAVVTQRSGASEDETAIAALIRDYQAAQYRATHLSSEAIRAVQADRGKLVEDSERAVVDDGAPPVDILPAAERERIVREDAAYKADFMSAALQSQCSKSESVADMIALGLYNNPDAPLVVDGRQEVLAVQVMKSDGASAVAWAYTWVGDVTEKGKGAQNWPVLEYRLVKEGGQWRIDGIEELGIMFPTPDSPTGDDAAEWGPASPHESIDHMGDRNPSQLYPNQDVPTGLLRGLEAKALATAE